MKKYIFYSILIMSFFSCSNEIPKYEYKVIEFQREDSEPFEETINKLGAEGWEYAGVITANGINGRYVAFKRRL